MSQEELARRLNLRGATISRYELGKAQIKADDLPVIAHELATPVSAFYDEEEDEESYEFAAVAHGRVADAAGPYLTGWERMRDHDRRLFVDVLEALSRWRDRALARRTA